MANTLSMMELAKVLGEWRPEAGKPPHPTEEVNEQIAQYVELFRNASPKERTEARKLFREKGAIPNWTAFEFWMPKTKEVTESIRLRMAAIAAAFGSTYRDGSRRFEEFEAELNKLGHDWGQYQTEYTLLAADFVAIPNDLPEIPSISAEDFAREIEKLNAAIANQSDSADLYYQRGVLRMRNREFDKAIFDLSKAIKLDRKNTDYPYQRAIAFASIGFVGHARGDFMTIIMSNPNHPQADYLRDKNNAWRYL